MNERVRKLNSVIATEVSSLILSEVDFKPGIFATISHVRTAEDLSQSRIYIQPFPSAETDYIMKTLAHEKYMIQKILHKRLHLKILPKIIFEADQSGLHVQDIDQALSKDA